jgi:hypothetical protein
VAAHDEACEACLLFGMIDVCIALKQCLNNFCIALVRLKAANSEEQRTKHHIIVEKLLINISSFLNIWIVDE